MSNTVHTAAEALQALKPHVASGVMVREEGAGFQLHAPTHGVSIRIASDGTLNIQGTSSTVEEFIGTSKSSPENFIRMYRHAFLKAHTFGSAVNIELNRTCSLSCPHCFIDPDRPDTGRSFPLEHLDTIRHLSPREISLTGGEVFASDSYKTVIEKLNSFPDKKNLTLRFLANGTWFQNPGKVKEVVSYLKDKCSLKHEFRFTLFDFRSEYHDLLAGAAGNFDDLMTTTKFLSDNGVLVSQNYTINSWNFSLRDKALQFLIDQCGDSFSLSSILYPTAKTRRVVKKLMIAPDQFRILLDEAPFRALASQYCDASSQCSYHCNYPLLTREGILFHCNLPGIPTTYSCQAAPLLQKVDLCKTCKAAQWCKKCPSAVPSFYDLYCPYAKIAADTISRDCDALNNKGYFLPDTTAV